MVPIVVVPPLLGLPSSSPDTLSSQPDLSEPSWNPAKDADPSWNALRSDPNWVAASKNLRSAGFGSEFGLPPSPDAEEQQEKFGFLLDALKYGCPPHGGIAFGLDRLVMLMSGASTIRDVMAFPKTQTAACPLTSAPARVSEAQLKELGIKLRKPPAVEST